MWNPSLGSGARRGTNATVVRSVVGSRLAVSCEQVQAVLWGGTTQSCSVAAVGVAEDDDALAS